MERITKTYLDSWGNSKTVNIKRIDDTERNFESKSIFRCLERLSSICV